MRALLRIGLTSLLAGVLALTSLTMAVARGEIRVAGEVVICSGEGMVVVRRDADGKPQGPAHICPDMALGLIAALDAVPPVLERPQTTARALTPQLARIQSDRAGPVARARGPPLSD